MSEEEIIKYLESYIQFHDFIDTGNKVDKELGEAIQRYTRPIPKRKRKERRTQKK